MLLKRPNAMRRFIETRLGAPVSKLTIGLELESDQTLIARVEAEIGIGFISDVEVSRPLVLGKLDVCDVRGVDFCRTFVAAYRSDRTLKRVAQQFVDWLTSIARH